MAKATRGVSSLHKMADPIAAESTGYQQGLSNVDATTRTADNILTVIGNNWVAMVVLTLIFIVVFSVFGSSIRNFFGKMGNLILSPLFNNKQEKEVSKETGLPFTAEDLSHGKAQSIADALAAAFKYFGDDEDEIFVQLGKIPTTNSWLLVIQKFDTRTVANGVFGWGMKKTLEQAIRDKLGRSDRKKCYRILTSNGVDPDYIHFGI